MPLVRKMSQGDQIAAYRTETQEPLGAWTYASVGDQAFLWNDERTVRLPHHDAIEVLPGLSIVARPGNLMFAAAADVRVRCERRGVAA